MSSSIRSESPLAAHRSILRTDELSDWLQREYAGIGKTSECCFFMRSTNDTYYVHADEGVFFLRVSPPRGRRSGWISSELQILDHLIRTGVPVSIPASASAGPQPRPLPCPEGLRHAVLFQSVGADPADYATYSLEQADHYGQAVALMHRAMTTYDGSRDRPSLEPSVLLRSSVRILQRAAPRDAERQLISGIATAALADLGKHFAAAKGFCHGDLHGQNAGWTGFGFVLYDFDNCGWGLRSYDLAVFPWVFVMRGDSPTTVADLLRSLIAGYERHAHFPDADRGVLPPLMVVRQLWYMALRIRRANAEGWSTAGDAFWARHLGVLQRCATIDRSALRV